MEFCLLWWWVWCACLKLGNGGHQDPSLWDVFSVEESVFAEDELMIEDGRLIGVSVSASILVVVLSLSVGAVLCAHVLFVG